MRWFVGGETLRVESLGRPTTDNLHTALRIVRAARVVRDRDKLKLITAPPPTSGEKTNADDRRVRKHPASLGKGQDTRTRFKTT
jgi:hypothetical protein